MTDGLDDRGVAPMHTGIFLLLGINPCFVHYVSRHSSTSKFIAYLHLIRGLMLYCIDHEFISTPMSLDPLNIYVYMIILNSIYITDYGR